MSPSAALSDPVDSSARSMLHAVLSHLKLRDFAVELWNGELWPAESAKPAFKLIFRSPKVVRAMFSHPSALSFGEAYIYGYLDVEGSLLNVFKSGERLLTIDVSWMEKWPGGYGRFPRRNIRAARAGKIFRSLFRARV